LWYRGGSAVSHLPKEEGGGTAEGAQAGLAKEVSSNSIPHAGRGGLTASCNTGEGVQYPTCQKRRVVVPLSEEEVWRLVVVPLRERRMPGLNR
jgi:hypothetical protein